MKQVFKLLLQAIALTLVFIPAACTGFGRISSLFVLFGQSLSLAPGAPGNYLRIAYYVLTLKRCSIESRVSFGTFFSKSNCVIESGVYIGSRCSFGACSIGARSQIADHVQILSGRRQHSRTDSGQILGSDPQAFASVSIGTDCWIGSGAIVMEDVGCRSTVGAGSVVTKPVPDDSIVVGNPARPLGSG